MTRYATREGTMRRALLRRGLDLTLEDPNRTFSTSTLGVTGSETTETVKCMPPTPLRSELVDGEGIAEGDLQTSIRADDLSSITPKAGFNATLDSKSFRVVGVTPVYEGPSVYRYQLHLRGSQ